ncbi:MAG: methyltransferase domain-containing protein [Candidatus Eremiobacteraeota bacterium]|nr:methyltransferase domain-containing protein [Candidatus Eremiobacteraeota bacterium]
MLAGSAPRSAYEELAGEYYDPVRHPTCANFRMASGIALRRALQKKGPLVGSACEVGSGDSLLAQILSESGASISRLLITDSSPAMLAYSERWDALGARRRLAEAASLPVADGSVDLLVSSLGDPYNDAGFWSEAGRVLAPGGRVLFTTPSYAWSHAFRSPERLRVAQFALADGRTLDVPSIVLPEARQRAMLSRAGLRVSSIDVVTLGELLPAVISPKLLPERGRMAPVVTLYEVARPSP